MKIISVFVSRQLSFSLLIPFFQIFVRIGYNEKQYVPVSANVSLYIYFIGWGFLTVILIVDREIDNIILRLILD